MKWAWNERFDGHLSHEDPRTPVTGAAGCVWPTIPAHRYRLSSDNAWGVLFPLRAQPILVEKVTPGDAHDACQWNMISGPPPILFAILWKSWNPHSEGYTWQLGITATLCGIMEIEIERPEERCNRDFIIGEMTCPAYAGGTGANFQARQVEWNKTAPPLPPGP